MAVKRPVRGEIKRTWQRNVTYVLVATVLFFVVFYVPQEIADPLSSGLADWSKLLVKVGVSLPVMFVVRWIIFAQDHLAAGRSAASQFFRHYYPSTLAVVKYNISRENADRLWFDYFNTWEPDKHRYHDDYERVFQRSYSLRLIFYLKRLLLVFVIAASIMTVALQVLRTENAQRWLGIRVTLILVAASLLLWLHVSNRFEVSKDRAGDYDATGAYFRYKEISGILRSRFEEDVLSKHSTPSPSSRNS